MGIESGQLKESESIEIRRRVLAVVYEAIRNHQIGMIHARGGEFLDEDEKKELNKIIKDAKSPRRVLIEMENIIANTKLWMQKQGRKLALRRSLSRSEVYDTIIYSMPKLRKYMTVEMAKHSELTLDHVSTDILIMDHPVAENETVTFTGTDKYIWGIYNEIAQPNTGRSAIMVTFSPSEQLISPKDSPSNWRRNIEADLNPIEQSRLLFVNMTTDNMKYTLMWNDGEFNSQGDSKIGLSRYEILTGLAKIQKNFNK